MKEDAYIERPRHTREVTGALSFRSFGCRSECAVNVDLDQFLGELAGRAAASAGHFIDLLLRQLLRQDARLNALDFGLRLLDLNVVLHGLTSLSGLHWRAQSVHGEGRLPLDSR